MIELQASNVTNGMDLPDSDWGDFSCRRAVDSSSYILIIVKDCLLVTLKEVLYNLQEELKEEEEAILRKVIEDKMDIR